MNFVARLFLLLPRRLALKFGALMGMIFYYVIPKRRKLALNNFKLALGDHYTPTQQKNIIKQVYKNLGMNFVEFFRFKEITSENLSQFVTFHGKEHFDKVYAENKGLLMLTGHFGNWEILAAAIALTGIKGGMVVKAAHQKFFNDFLTQQRESKGIHLFYGKNSLKNILRFIKSGGALGVVVDQNAIRDNVVVPFFGRPAGTLRGLAVFSQWTDAPVIPAYSYRDENLHHHIVIEPPLQHRDSTPEGRTLQYTQWIEKIIRERPDQWMWTHNRWKV